MTPDERIASRSWLFFLVFLALAIYECLEFFVCRFSNISVVISRMMDCFGCCVSLRKA